MLYFSEIKGRLVFTEDDVMVGRLTDLIFLASDKPKITKIVIKTKKDSHLIVPIESVIKIDNKVILGKSYESSKLEENELFLMKNLLDTQIIDIAGSKMVRVNDVVIAEKPEYHLAGVDIGILGILRWFKIEDLVNKFLINFGKRLTSKFLSWGDIQPLELTRGHVKIKTEEKRFERIRPEDLADYLEKTNILNVRNILNILDEKTAAQVIGELNLTYQSTLFKHFKSEKIAKIVSLIDPEEGVDILLALPKKRREKVIENLNPEKREKIEYLLRLSKTPIGEILTTEFLTVGPNDSVKQVIEKIKKETVDFRFLPYVYVINKNNQLVGVMSLHELVIHDRNTPVYKFMVQNLAVIYLSTPELVAFKKLVKYAVFALPVVDKDRHMLGVVIFNDMVELISDENT